jgi:hypothetical protein
MSLFGKKMNTKFGLMIAFILCILLCYNEQNKYIEFKMVERLPNELRVFRSPNSCEKRYLLSLLEKGRSDLLDFYVSADSQIYLKKIRGYDTLLQMWGYTEVILSHTDTSGICNPAPR